MGYKRLSLTDIKIEIGRGAKAKTVDAKYGEADVDAQGRHQLGQEARGTQG